jgi:hemolysin activation/secretion protein
MLIHARRAPATAARTIRTCVAGLVLAACLWPLPARAAADAPARRFDIEEYRVEGNTLLPPAAIEAAVYGFLGPGRTAEDVEHARAALEKLYQSRGYATVSAEVPVQRVADGVVVIHVSERRVGRLRVTGSRYFRLSDIKAGAPSLAEGRVPNLDDVKRDILALNQWPDRAITPVLKPGRAPDTVDVDLQVADHLPLHGSLELNNRQSADTTPLRVAGSLSYGDLWQRGDSATVFFQVAPQRTADALAYSASYLFHVPGSKISILASYFRSDSNVTAVGSTDVVGKGDIIGARVLIPVAADGETVQTFSVGADNKRFGQDITVSGSASKVPIEYTTLAASYQATWIGDAATTNAILGLVAGLRPLSNSNYAFQINRKDAEPSFFDVRLSADRLQELPAGLQGFARAQAQLSREPLVPNEQLSLGGLDSVRGYRESEVLGDVGGSLQLELRSPELAEKLGGTPVNNLRLHTFYDVGRSGVYLPVYPQYHDSLLSSVGAGVRVRLYDHLNGEVQGARTLQTGQVTPAGSEHFLFRVFGDF